MSNARVSGHFVLAALCAPLFLGGACEKKPNKPDDTGAIGAMDRANANAGGSGAVEAAAGNDTTALPGIDISGLDAEKTKLFYQLVNSLKSPCGKAHSLRTSFTSDSSCKRAPFAARYVAAMLSDEATDAQAREWYAKKYDKPSSPVSFDVSKAPHAGSDDARIKLVEFYDYECPHCALFRATLDQVMAEKGSQVGVSFMQFPLESIHPQSVSAAQAALAAAKQGKFHEMHEKLFNQSPRHARPNAILYAKDLGLDIAKFEKDYDEALVQVKSDEKQGEAAGVDSTPSVFFNDRRYEGPMTPKYLEMWIDEEIAVNR